MGMDFSHKFMEMQAFLSLDWQVAVAEVQQEPLAAPDTAPDMDASQMSAMQPCSGKWRRQASAREGNV